MAKRPSKHLRPPRPLSTTHAASVKKSDGTWMVQTKPASASASAKSYVCPGCQQPVSAGVGHLVVWPTVASIGSASAVDERRHWHTACWNRRR